MRWKLYTYILILICMIPTVPTLKVMAQGLVEYALILVVATVGPGETAEFHWLPQANQGDPQVPTLPPGTTATWTIVVTNTGDLSCTPEVITTAVNAAPGLNTLNLARTGIDLVVNGQNVHTFKDECLGENYRVAYQVGVPFPPGLADPDSLDARALAMKIPPPGVLGYTIVANGGGTAASSQSRRNNLGLFILDIGTTEPL